MLDIALAEVARAEGGAGRVFGSRSWYSGRFPGVRERSREGFRELGTRVWEVPDGEERLRWGAEAETRPTAEVGVGR